MELKKSNIVLIGMPGCGKSTIGRKLSARINWNFIDVDILIEERTGKSIPEIFQSGEDYFRDIESNVIEELEHKTSTVISTGGGIVKREKNIESLSKHGFIIFINRSPEKILKDIDIASRPLLSTKKENLLKLYAERIDLYKKYSDIEISNDCKLKATLNKLYLICKERGLL
ncbi:shikimate kinase [Clostridium thermarum]|uniref:shikimate kinase n=1 Tax=Clostridium thermarum TaxID=1716543 RepID=UPI0013D0A0AE|nr:shikimate kinase [Clostridium thermarum]